MMKYLKKLHWQILIAMLLGVLLSFLLPPNKRINETIVQNKVPSKFISFWNQTSRTDTLGNYYDDEKKPNLQTRISSFEKNLLNLRKDFEIDSETYLDLINEQLVFHWELEPIDFNELENLIERLKKVRKNSFDELTELYLNNHELALTDYNKIEFREEIQEYLRVSDRTIYYCIVEIDKLEKSIKEIDEFLDDFLNNIVKIEYKVSDFERGEALLELKPKDLNYEKYENYLIALNKLKKRNWNAIYNADNQTVTLKSEENYYIDRESLDNPKYETENIFIEDNSFNKHIYMLGDIFIALLKMMIIPLIITSIIVGVTNIKDKATIGRLGKKTFGYYLLTSIVAIITGLALANILRPGDSFSLEYLTGEDLSQKAKSVKDLIMSFIMNPIQAAASGKTLPSIFFAILLGISINYLPKDLNKSAVSFFDAMYRAVLRITTWIIKLAPIGVFALIFKTLNTSGVELLKSVLVYSMTLIAGLSIHILITLPIIFYLFTKINPLIHYRAILPAMFTAFSTSSSSATLPVTMNCSTKNAGVSKNVSGFVLPLGSTVNMDGTALFECAGVLFISQILGVNLDFSAQLTVVMIAFLASVGAAGVPHAGLVMIFIVLDAVGLSSYPQVPLIVATMFAIDRPLDMMRTMVNVTSDTVGASVIAKSEGENLYSKES